MTEKIVAPASVWNQYPLCSIPGPGSRGARRTPLKKKCYDFPYLTLVVVLVLILFRRLLPRRQCSLYLLPDESLDVTSVDLHRLSLVRSWSVSASPTLGQSGPLLRSRNSHDDPSSPA
ncbi:hypothetical protein AAG570_002650 [Ranatra chinensis]|uniref:Uncharacterized protein n=1 Tax=Ranatra chinensis TaxID=642074 RepID=A0ABD0YA91_9HEMI